MAAVVAVVLQLLVGRNTTSAFRQQCPRFQRRAIMSPPLQRSVRAPAAAAPATSATATTDGASSSCSLDRLLAPLPPHQLVEYLRKGHTAVRGLFSQEEVRELRPKVLAAFEAEELEALRHEVR